MGKRQRFIAVNIQQNQTLWMAIILLAAFKTHFSEKRFEYSYRFQLVGVTVRRRISDECLS